jgi:hypothetical protein
LTIEERKQMASKRLNLKKEIFNPNFLIMHSNFLNSEINALESESEDGEIDYVSKL